MIVHGIRLTLQPDAARPVGSVSLLRPNARGKWVTAYTCNAQEIPDSLHGAPFTPFPVLQFDPASDVWTAPAGIEKLLLIVNPETHRLHPVRPRPESWAEPRSKAPTVPVATAPVATDPDAVVELGEPAPVAPTDSSITADTELPHVTDVVVTREPIDLLDPVNGQRALDELAAEVAGLPPISTGDDPNWGPAESPAAEEEAWTVPSVGPAKPEDAGS